MSARALFLGIAAALLGQPAVADLWVWTDPDGVVRYTSHRERIPDARRTAAARVEPGMKLPTASPGPGGAGTAGAPVLYAPPDEISFASDPFNAPEQVRDLKVDEVAEPESNDPWRTSSEQKLPAGATAAAGAGSASGARGPTPPVSAATPTPPRSDATTAPVSAATPTPPRSDATTAPVSAGVATAAAAPRAPEPPHLPPALTSEQKQRKADLERLIERDQETLKTLISDAEVADLETSAALREIAQRLPELQAELRALERGESTLAEPAR